MSSRCCVMPMPPLVMPISATRRGGQSEVPRSKSSLCGVAPSMRIHFKRAPFSLCTADKQALPCHRAPEMMRKNYHLVLRVGSEQKLSIPLTLSVLVSCQLKRLHEGSSMFVADREGLAVTGGCLVVPQKSHGPTHLSQVLHAPLKLLGGFP